MTELIRKLSPEDVIKKYGSIHDSIFRKDGSLEAPFLSSNWEVVLLPYGELRFSDVDFFALMQAAESIGSKKFIITSAEDYGKSFSPPLESIELPWDRELLNEVRNVTVLGIFDSHIFDQSGIWGVVSYWDHYFCVGGDETFMDLFTRKAGGRVALKERFLEYAKSLDWYVTGNAQKREVFKNKILKSVGWD
jgi:hypothetical protein